MRSQKRLQQSTTQHAKEREGQEQLPTPVCWSVCVQVTGFKRPEKPLVLYEFQGCPFCKKVG
jgi:hypothetical protein